MKKNIIIILFFVVLSLICVSSSSYAEDPIDTGGASGAGGDGTGSLACTYNLCSEYGATWRWYPWEPADADKIYIPGTINGNNDWSPGYAKDTIIEGCKEEGGYWRYALVAERTIPGARTTNCDGYCDHRSVRKGDQVGNLAIGAKEGLASEYLDGFTKYREEYDHGKSWEQIKDLYEQSKKTKSFKI